MAREDISLLEALREDLSVRSVKDGCSPQGQCGCCTVLVDGSPRVSCVTPLRRVAGRSVTTVSGLPGADRLVASFVAHGASQCGFCTPGILCRLAALAPGASEAQVETALLAHLCRCTGWRSIAEAFAASVPAGPSPPAADATSSTHPPMPAGLAPPAVAGSSASAGSSPSARHLPAGRQASVRAGIEGGVAQSVGPDVVVGAGGFADDSAPPGALVAVPIAGADPSSPAGWSVATTLAEARAGAGKIQGRRSGGDPAYPVDVPDGDWDITLQTTWVEPGYLEPDASWCAPGGPPASPYGNGGAFGAKLDSLAPAAARMLADHHGVTVRVAYSREDVVRLGPKRPPVGAGVRLDGSGVLRLGWSPGQALPGGPALSPPEAWSPPGQAPPGQALPGGPALSPPEAWPVLSQALSPPGQTSPGPAPTPGRASPPPGGALLPRLVPDTSTNRGHLPDPAGDSLHKVSWGLTYCPEIAVETVPVHGPPTSLAIRAAGGAELAVLQAAAAATAAGRKVAIVTTTEGARAEAVVTVDQAGWPTGVEVEVDAGDPLDEVVLTSYVQGAAHMALGWVCSEAIAVDDRGVPTDLTIRSFGILRAKDTPPIAVRIAPGAGRPPMAVADAAFAAVAAATWLAQGLPSRWPTRRGTRR